MKIAIAGTGYVGLSIATTLKLNGYTHKEIASKWALKPHKSKPTLAMSHTP